MGKHFPNETEMYAQQTNLIQERRMGKLAINSELPSRAFGPKYCYTNCWWSSLCCLCRGCSQGTSTWSRPWSPSAWLCRLALPLLWSFAHHLSTRLARSCSWPPPSLAASPPPAGSRWRWRWECKCTKPLNQPSENAEFRARGLRILAQCGTSCGLESLLMLLGVNVRWESLNYTDIYRGRKGYVCTRNMFIPVYKE